MYVCVYLIEIYPLITMLLLLIENNARIVHVGTEIAVYYSIQEPINNRLMII